ncbi:MAG: 30S ribosome-binding factor RbfA [Planctomycetaceae bacterium]
MPDDRRLRRLEKQILHTLAPLISHGLLDPRLRLVTVTRVRLSADLGIARVNWSCIGSEADRSKAAHALEHARGRLQGAVAGDLGTRTTPRLLFHFDETGEKALRVQEILAELARQRGDPPPPAGTEPPAEELDEEFDEEV